MTTLELNLTSKSEWIEMFPFGIAMGANNMRPVMIFKDKTGKRVLPIWLSHIDAGIAVAQSNAPYSGGARIDGSPHELSWQILSRLGVELEKCLFKTVKGHHQYVELHFKSSLEKKAKLTVKKLQMLESRADDAISFVCARAANFATIDYIERSRVLESEMVGTVINPQTEMNPHRYLN